MNLSSLRRWSSTIAFATLIAFWNATLQASFAKAQSAPAEAPAEAPAPQSDSTGQASGTYDSSSRKALSEHLADSPAATVPDSAGAPADIADVDKALAALPSGGGEVSPQAAALPSGAATQLGMGESFTTQLSTGTVAYGVPISLPSARGGVQPRLDLAYSSSGGFGVAGVGWSIGASSISRQTDRGLPTYDDRASWHPEQDRFVFGGMELVPICSVTGSTCAGAIAGEQMPSWANGWQYFRARAEGGFLRFFWSPDHLTWRVQGKDGMNLELGIPLDGTAYAGALERNPDSPSEIYRWHVVRQYDSEVTTGSSPQPVNTIVYRYMTDGNAVYLTDIFDTSPAATPTTTNLALFAHHAAIAYESRPDVSTSYRAGYSTDYALRVARVDVASKRWSGGVNQPRELLRRYYLGYDSDSHRSLLTSVQIEGRCAAPVQESAAQALPLTTCPRLPAITFEYQRVAGDTPALYDAQGYAYEAFDSTVRTLESSPPYSLDEGRTDLTDINADGLPDVLVTAPALFGGQHGVYFNGLDSHGAAGFAKPSRMAVHPAADVIDADVLSLDSPVVAALDLDADGLVNLVHMPQARRYSVFSPQPTAPGASTYEWVGREVLTASEQDVKIDFTRNASNTRVMDVNGDGLVDIVYSSSTELQTFFSLGRYPGGDDQFGHATWTSATTASISNEPVVQCIPWSSTPVRFSDPDTQLADMNGDGLVDIVRVRSGQVLYWPGRGNGFWGLGQRDDCSGNGFAEDRHVEMYDAPQFGNAQPGTLLLNDVNGDGLADMVEVRNQGVDIYLNDNAIGWTSRSILDKTPFRPSDSNYVRLTDIDGSGTPDILWGRAYEYKYIDLTGGKTPYLLTKVENGLGKTAQLEYASSTDLMLGAAAAGQPWASHAPINTPVLLRSTVRDNLNLVGRSGGTFVTEYNYRDPVYEGRQREFRGFREATVTSLGDSSSPTSFQRTLFQLGESPATVATSSTDPCVTGERWNDNGRESLKGLPVVNETFDAQGLYASTEHTAYKLRQLYSGRDCRRVVMTMPVRKDVYLYDTAGFDYAPSVASVPEVSVELTGVTPSTESRAVTLRATAGTAHIQSETVYDDFGNIVDSIQRGCTSGCPNGADEVITSHSDFILPSGDSSAWLWREQHSYTTGSVNTARRSERVHTYNAHGDVEESYAVLSGTLALDRFHATGQTIAPSPPDQSGGIAGSVQILTGDHSYDTFGHITFTRGPNGSCSAGDFDPDYAHLPVVARTYAGSLNTGTNCGSNLFTNQVTYDRGFEAVVTSTSATGQPSRFDYDGFARLVAATHADPNQPGQLAAYPSMTATYTLPTQASVTPYTVSVVRSQDGLDLNTNSYRESWTYSDGLGRTIALLTAADTSAGDSGSWIVNGDVDYDAKGATVRTYDPWFYNGSPANYPLGSLPTTPYKSREYDAFGRAVHGYGYDRQIENVVVSHALSTDAYDVADILPSSHQNTFATVVSDGHGRGVQRIERIKVGSQIELRSLFNEYLPTGEIVRVTQRVAGSPDVVRWLRYDSLGRMVLNVEPNTSSPFNPDPNASPSTFKALRYAYDDTGDMVGYSDARGCGANYIYDTAGRMLAEDRSPCLAQHAAYSSPNLSTGDGTEAFYRYDTTDPDSSTIVDAAGVPLGVNASLLWGRVASVSGPAAKAVYRYDALGRSTGIAVRVQKPGPASSTLASRYASRWYLKTQTLDAMNRVKTSSTGVTTPELLGSDGTSEVRLSYSKRGALKQVGSSYGQLLAGEVRLADGRVQSFTLGDASGTQRYFTYDVKHRVQGVQSYRGNLALWTSPPVGSSYTPPSPIDDPTRQLLLEDTSLIYDLASNLTRVEDHRIASDWPATAKPVTRNFEYDDLNRMTRATYEYSGGTADSWKSPYERENQDPTRPQPSPQVSFSTRVTEQRYQYDWLGNMVQATDDQQAFWDRSTGDRAHGVATSGPHQVRSASNRTLAPSSTRKGDLSVGYDPAGNMTGLIVRRDGACLPASASCWQRFDYEWDETGGLTRARRWDLATAPNERTSNGQLAQPVPARAPDAELRYYYDATGARVLKTAVDKVGLQKHTAYVFSSLELRSTDFSGDYVLSPETVSVRLFAGPVTARVVYSLSSMPAVTSSRQHVLLSMGDYLGSTTFLIDHATGELVENSTYQAYGAAETDYRPNRWQGFREPYKFSGKEEDIEVGLSYFGARYYSPYLNVWISPDPVTIHDLGSDTNPYAYVHGMPTMAVDPDGDFVFLVFLAAVLISAAISAGVNAGVQYANTGHIALWGSGGVAAAFGTGLIAGAVSGGIGGFVGGAVAGATGSGVLGGLAGGAAGGVAGGAAGYTAGAAFGAHDFNGAGIAEAMAFGGVAGAVGGGAGAWAGARLGDAGGALVGGAVGGSTDYVTTGIATGDWSAQSFALSVGVGVAGAMAAYGAGRALAAMAPAGPHPSEETARAQKTPAGVGVKTALNTVDAFWAVDDVAGNRPVTDGDLLRIDVVPDPPAVIGAKGQVITPEMFAVEDGNCATGGGCFPHVELTPEPNAGSPMQPGVGKGSTARLSDGTTVARTLREQVAIEQAASNPAAGRQTGVIMSDPRWPAPEGWVKMQMKIPGGGAPVNVHYNYNTLTGATDDFKIVLPGRR